MNVWLLPVLGILVDERFQDTVRFYEFVKRAIRIARKAE